MGKGKLVQISKEHWQTAKIIAADSDKEIGQVVELSCETNPIFKQVLRRVKNK